MPVLRTAPLAPALGPASRTSSRNSSRLSPVACMILASDAVEGQRGRPLAERRFDLLKAVESSPARLARPEADSEWRDASASMAAQTWSCESMAAPHAERKKCLLP